MPQAKINKVADGVLPADETRLSSDPSIDSGEHFSRHPDGNSILHKVPALCLLPLLAVWALAKRFRLTGLAAGWPHGHWSALTVIGVLS